MRAQLQEYLELLEGQNKAEGTIQQYSGGLKVFSEWLDLEGVDPEELDTRDIQHFLAWMNNEKGFAPKTIRGYFSAVSGFYGDLDATGRMEEDPTEDVVVADYAAEETLKERATKERRVWLSKDDLEQLVEHVPAPTIRNRLLVLFQYYTGLRRQEVAEIKVADLDREHRRVQIRGKNGTVTTAHWRPKLDGLLRTWLDNGYRDASPYANESPYLFLSESGPSINGDVVNKVVVQAAKNAGIQEILYEDAAGRSRYKYTSHVLRHSFAMHWLQNGGSLEALSKYLAHSSVTTTEIYGEILEDRAKDEYDQFAPDVDLSV